jgi:hypothetical protein
MGGIRMTRGKSLKEQNAWLIRTALVLHACAFAYVIYPPSPLAQMEGVEFLRKVHGVIAPGSIAIGFIALTKLVLLGIFPARLRDVLIHWRYPHPLPGSRAFTKIGPGDSRVSMENLTEKYGPLPTDPAKQDLLFYSIYKAHADDIGVLDAHKSYLAARDLATITLVLLFLLVPLGLWFVPDHQRVFMYGLGMLAVYALTCIAAQRYDTRLVQNALAVASVPPGASQQQPTRRRKRSNASRDLA